MSGKPDQPEFDLFISYVRRDARKLVEGRRVDVVALLKRELEKHSQRHKGYGKRRRFRVCTDLDDFVPDGTFHKVMQARISASRGFLLVCSPGVADSHYVRQELEIHNSLNDQPFLAALLSVSSAEIPPEIFHGDQVAVDLSAPQDITLRELRSLLRRESHKIVARIWDLPLTSVYDRFEADRRSIRRRIFSATIAVLLFIVVLTVALGGEAGLHRTAVLPLQSNLVAPAGVGFAADGRTPVIIHGDTAWIWSKGIDHPPQPLVLPFRTLHAMEVRPGTFFIAGLDQVAKVSIPGSTAWVKTLPGPIEGIAAAQETMLVSNENGALFFVTAESQIAAPRPMSVTGQRFKAFRERGPFQFGNILATAGEHYLATATLTGHLAIFDRLRSSFIIAPNPQFPLANPVEQPKGPVLYETENTRPIGALAFLPDSNLLFSEGEGLRRVEIATGQITALTHCPIELVRQIIPTDEGRTLIVLTSSTLEVLRFSAKNTTHLACKQRASLAPNFAPRAAMAPDRQTILIVFFDGRPELWQPTFRLFGFDLKWH